MSADQDFFLAHCPERINPGDKKWNIANIPRVIGGTNELSVSRAKIFYSRVTNGHIQTVANMAEAVASKMIENAFRDVNIAFVNEMARSFDGTNINIYRVLDAAATKPFGYMEFLPGMGVGGHCIPIDPHYIISAAKERGFEHAFLQLARDINDGMVDYVIDKIIKFINKNHVTNPRIGVLGLTYKPNIADTRESQSLRLIEKLNRQGFETKAYDPFVKSDSSSEHEVIEWANIIITAVDHEAFVNLATLINEKQGVSVVIDTANMIRPKDLLYAKYEGIGI